MPQVTVDNQPVTVLLGDNETYSPASGSVQDVTIAASRTEEMKIDDGSGAETIIDSTSDDGQDSISVVIDDSITVQSASNDALAGVYVSGFEVN
jgi:cAMP phosphodiesterase